MLALDHGISPVTERTVIDIVIFMLPVGGLVAFLPVLGFFPLVGAHNGQKGHLVSAGAYLSLLSCADMQSKAKELPSDSPFRPCVTLVVRPCITITLQNQTIVGCRNFTGPRCAVSAEPVLTAWVLVSGALDTPELVDDGTMDDLGIMILGSWESLTSRA